MSNVAHFPAPGTRSKIALAGFLTDAYDYPAPIELAPCDIKPIDTLADPIVGEFSEYARGKHSWSLITLIFLAIAVPLVFALVIA